MTPEQVEEVWQGLQIDQSELHYDYAGSQKKLRWMLVNAAIEASQASAPTDRDMALCEEALAAEIAHTKRLQAELDRLKASAPTPIAPCNAMHATPSDEDRAELQAVCASLSEVSAPTGAPSDEHVSVVGMPEFDALLDHIYEHGTTSEGVRSRADALARALLTRFGGNRGC